MSDNMNSPAPDAGPNTPKPAVDGDAERPGSWCSSSPPA